MELADRIAKIEAEQSALSKQLDECHRLISAQEGWIRNHSDIIELHDCMLSNPGFTYRQALMSVQIKNMNLKEDGATDEEIHRHNLNMLEEARQAEVDRFERIVSLQSDVLAEQALSAAGEILADESLLADIETGEEMLNRDAVARGLCPHCGKQVE